VGPVDLGLRGTTGNGGGSLSRLHSPVPVGALESVVERLRTPLNIFNPPFKVRLEENSNSLNYIIK